jgi:hypothetical protein
MKEKLLSFAFNFFCESGLLKGLQPIQIKKSPLGCGRLEHHQSRPFSSRLATGASAVIGSAAEKSLAHIPFFRKKMQAPAVSQKKRPPGGGL